jgi:hypothetical protein
MSFGWMTGESDLLQMMKRSPWRNRESAGLQCLYQFVATATFPTPQTSKATPSVYQTDIIYYGANLRNYFENEFHYYFKTPEYSVEAPIREIELWSRLVAENC